MFFLRFEADRRRFVDFQIRIQQRHFVRERFQRSSAAIDRCIQTSAGNLTELTKDFLEIYNKIQKSKQRIENVRKALSECKNLLVLKIQNIRKLWLLTIEQNATVTILERVSQVKRLESRLKFYFQNGLFVHSCLLLLKSKELTELRTIGGLSSIDQRIRDEHFALEDHLCRELIEQIFKRPSIEFFEEKSRLNQSSTRETRNRTSFQRENRIRRKQFDISFDEEKLPIESEFLSIIPDEFNAPDLRSKSNKIYLDVLLQSLSILFHLNETLELVRRKFHQEFHQIVSRTTNFLLDSLSFHSHRPNSELIVNEPNVLRELFQYSFEQFQLVVKNFEYLIEFLEALRQSRTPMQIQQRVQLDSKSGSSLRLALLTLFNIDPF